MSRTPQPYIVDSAGYAYGPLITDGTKDLRLDPGERIMQLIPSDLTLHGYVRADRLPADVRPEPQPGTLAYAQQRLDESDEDPDNDEAGL